RDRHARFTEAEANLAAATLRGLMWFHRQLLRDRGLLLVQSPLTPQERNVFTHLLSEKPIKQIAAAINLSPHTVGDHIKSIFRKYGVTSRTELMAIWLNRC